MTNSSPPMLSPEEQEQLLQTIEMFEVIVQANPHDCQSLEILKDAYSRLGMKRELMKVSRRMAQTFMELGQFATAILEFEQILRSEPDDPEVIAALGDCEERMLRATKPSASPSRGGAGSGGTTTDVSGLITTSATHRIDPFRGAGGTGGGADTVSTQALAAGDGNEALAKFLILHKLAPEDLTQAALERVQKVNASLKPSTLGISLLDEIVARGGAEMESLLAGIVERTKFSYIPLEYYDVDRHVIRMLPEDLTLKRLIVPFDLMSRTVMMAMANPFDSAAKEAAQGVLDYNIQWHIASPEAISKVLTQAYRIGTSGATHAAPVAASATPKEAPVFGEMPVPLPIPELKVASTSAPLTPGSESKSGSPLPDTSELRLKK